jgi:hypothetical protein
VEPGEDEELPQPHQHGKPPGARRLRLDLGLAALLLGAAALIGTAISQHGQSGNPSTSPSGSASVSRTTATPERAVATDFVTLHAGTTTTRISDAARDALQDAFPGARIIAARTVRVHGRNNGGALSALNVTARQGDKRIALALRGALRTDVSRDVGARTGRAFSGGHRITSYEAPLAQYDVVVQVVSPRSKHQDVAPLARLASDTRLLAK